MLNKTLIGKENYLFLINDTNKELEVHCNNLNLVDMEKLKNYTFQKYMMIVFPNKSFIYKEYLPDNYKAKYRPAVEIYKNKFQNKLIDTYNILKNEEDTYYKTDTHINLKGNYIVYKKFIEKANELYNLNLIPKQINLLMKKCELNKLPYGIGDLTWSYNLGNQLLIDKIDNFYYSKDIPDFYNVYKIIKTDNLRFLDYQLNDETENLKLKNEIAHWLVISKHIIYKKNIDKSNNPIKVIIFYDSFLLNILPLYLEMFYEVYFIKFYYNNTLIELIKPDYVFEFRLERFLC
jgi:hypothetical protein